MIVARLMKSFFTSGLIIRSTNLLRYRNSLSETILNFSPSFSFTRVAEYIPGDASCPELNHPPPPLPSLEGSLSGLIALEFPCLRFQATLFSPLD